MNITFLGAAREVTGSCYRIDSNGRSFLVDHGLYQGGMDAYRKNRARPRFDPREIDFVLLTHAHIDHSGLVPRPECSILFTGFQAAGTLGRRLVDGARVARIFGEDVPVRARIWTVGGLSAHADRDGLIDWLQGFRKPPSQAYVVHGESATAQGFAQLVGERLGWNAVAPGPGETYSLTGASLEPCSKT